MLREEPAEMLDVGELRHPAILPRPFGSVHELIAEAPHRDQVRGAMRVLLDLLSDALHVNVECLRVPVVVGPPDLVDEEIAGEQPSLPRQKELEEGEFLWGE